jgi:hypothetical protein
LRKFIHRFDRDEGGAVLLLMLAAVMVLMLMIWMIVDLSFGANQKVEAQSAADTAALSQAAVKARSMNMMAYANVSKRSVFLAHATYLAQFIAYAQWSQIIEGAGRALCCMSAGEFDFGCKLKNIGYASIKKWEIEAANDFANFSGGQLDFSTTVDADGNSNSEVGGSHQAYLNHGTNNENQSGTGGEYDEGNDDIGSACEFNEMSGLRLGTGTVKDVMSDFLTGFFGMAMGIIEEMLDHGIGAVPDYIKRKTAELLAEMSNQLGDLLFSVDNLRPYQDWAGLTQHYYAQDLKALDNYQRYLAGLTPWWAWSEGLTRALRNGATTSGSFPRPPGMRLSTEKLATKVSGALGVNLRMDNSVYSDALPVRPGIGPRTAWGPSGKPKGKHKIDYMYEAIPAETNFLQSSLLQNLITNVIGIGGTPNTDFTSDPLFYEHMVNLLLSALSSGYPDGSILGQAVFGVLITGRTHNLLLGRSALDYLDGAGGSPSIERTGTLEFVQEVFEDKLGAFTVNPWLVNRYGTRSAWMAKSSNIVFAYVNRGGAADVHKQEKKYDIVDTTGQEPGSSGGWVGEQIAKTIYGTSGYWAMARAEISFQGRDDERPDLWSPLWTARMRPVSLPSEFEQGEYTLSEVFHDALPTMVMAHLINATDFQVMGQSIIDFLQAMRSTRAMGESTVEGVAK